MSNVVVQTAFGNIRGSERDGVTVFKGIPYAAPAAGENRFMPTQTPRPWPGVRDALEFGPIVPQPPSPPELSNVKLPQSEVGCLTLNIWTPSIDSRKRPVMFWIHGGSLKIGSGAEIDGGKLAARGDVVVVSINYRLGVLGFLYVPGKTANVGILDQIEALRWVKQNIDHFGGDPGNITVFGESAGAHSITVLMSMPRARGLFRRAISQSSGCSVLYHKASGGEAAGRGVFSKLGITYGDLEALQAVSLADLQSAYDKTEAITSPFDFFPPFVDGDTVPVHPLEAIGNGYAVDIELLAGFNSNEASLFSLWDPEVNRLTEDTFRQRISFFFTLMMGAKQDPRVADKFVNFYLEASRRTSLRHAWEDYYTDNMFRVPIVRFLGLQSGSGACVYAYEFAWKTPELGGMLGSPHALDIGFVFGTLGDSPNGVFPARSPETDTLSQAMMDSWVQFARTGNPNHKGIPAWPKYKPDSRQIMVFDRESHVAADRYAERDRIWEGFL